MARDEELKLLIELFVPPKSRRQFDRFAESSNTAASSDLKRRTDEVK